MANEQFLTDVRELGVLYSKTKKYILNAEEVDPELKSNISINKEQRDALDHVMRALVEYLDKGDGADEHYLCQQIDNARGHMFRAAYDALDGAGISYKLRIQKAMANLPNDAIAAVYPDYFHVDLPLVNKIERKIVEHRQAKDERTKTTMTDLDAYISDVEKMSEIATGILDKVPAFYDWKARNRRKTIAWIVLLPVGLILLAAALNFATTAYWNAHPRSQQKSSATTSSTPNPSTQPAISASPTIAPAP